MNNEQLPTTKHPASLYPAQSAGDALALSDSPVESRGRPREGGRADTA